MPIHWAICRQTVAALSPRAHLRTGSAHMQIMSKLFNFLEALTQPIALYVGIPDLVLFFAQVFPYHRKFLWFFLGKLGTVADLRNVLKSWRLYCILIFSFIVKQNLSSCKSFERGGKDIWGKCIIVFHTLPLKSKGRWIASILTRM